MRAAVFNAFGNALSSIAYRHRVSTDRGQIEGHERLSARTSDRPG